jgi:hypothetical protein
MSFTFLLRMTRWVRNPPSPKRVYLYASVIVACLGLAGLQWLGLWPEWLTLTPGRRMPQF